MPNSDEESESDVVRVIQGQIIKGRTAWGQLDRRANGQLAALWVLNEEKEDLTIEQESLQQDLQEELSRDPQEAIAKREIKVELLRIEATLRDINERLSKYTDQGHGSLEELEDTILDVDCELAGYTDQLERWHEETPSSQNHSEGSRPPYGLSRSQAQESLKRLKAYDEYALRSKARMRAEHGFARRSPDLIARRFAVRKRLDLATPNRSLVRRHTSDSSDSIPAEKGNSPLRHASTFSLAKARILPRPGTYRKAALYVEHS